MDPYESLREKPLPTPVPRRAYGPEVTFPRNTAEDSIINTQMARAIFKEKEQETKMIKDRVLPPIAPKPIAHYHIPTRHSYGPDSERKAKEEDATMKMYEAQAIVIEKEQELEEKDKKLKEKDVKIELMEKEIERLQLEKQNQSLQKVALIEQSGSVAGGDNAQLSKQVTELKRIVEDLKRKDNERNQQMQSMSVFLSSVQAHISRLDGLIISQSGLYSNQEQTTNASIAQINSQLISIHSNISQMNAALKQQAVPVVNKPKPLIPLPVKAPKKKKISNAQNQSVANKTSILVMRGWERQPAAFIYNSSTEAWQRLGFTLPSEMSRFGVAVIKEEIYIFGGFLKYCFKLENDGSWNRMADMNEERIDIENSSIVYKDQIWVIGGSNSEFDELCSVEKYIPSANKWVAMAKTNFPRKHCSTAVLNGKLYVSGGISSAASSIEVFDTEIHKWILFCQMPIELTGHCMLAFRGDLIFLGGYGMQNYENVYYNDVWKLNPNKQITEISKFTTARGNFGAVNLLNNLMIFGGTSGINSLYSSEMFDGEKWTEKATLLEAIKNVAYTSLSRSLEDKLLQLF